MARFPQVPGTARAAPVPVLFGAEGGDPVAVSPPVLVPVRAMAALWQCHLQCWCPLEPRLQCHVAESTHPSVLVSMPLGASLLTTTRN